MIFKRHIAPTLLSLQKIWDVAPHNAMTDLIRYKDNWFCSFRESDSHMNGVNGQVRLLTSQDSLLWKSAALFVEPGVDLRDPKLSITPSGELMLLMGGTVLDSNLEYDHLQSRVTFSKDGTHWSPLTKVLEKHEWLWRVTWHRGKAYGASYSRSDPGNKRKEWNIKLFESSDGIHYDLLTHWDIPSYPNETTLRFLKDGTMVALVRREGKLDNNNWLGTSEPPYTRWTWKVLSYHIGGPNFIVLPDESLWVSGRLLYTIPYADVEKTFVGTIENKEVKPLLILPSGGDCSYPGLVFHDDNLWVSYYSSHETNTAIYLARLGL